MRLVVGAALGVALAGCRRPPPDSPSHGWTTTDDESETASDTGPNVSPTGSTGDTATGPPCLPGASRRIAGNLDLELDAHAIFRRSLTDHFGFVVAGAGDVTGDGVADVVAHTLEEVMGVLPVADQGGVYLLPSPISPGVTDPRDSGIRFVDADPGSGLHWWFTYAGGMHPLDDLNGDGLPELALSSYRFSPPGEDYWYGQGTVFVVASPVSASPGSTFPVDPSYARIAAAAGAVDFGFALGTGDVGGDAFQDLLVAARTSQDSDGGYRGEVFAFLGPLPPGEYTEDAAAFRIYGDNPLPLTGGGPLTMGHQILVGDAGGDGVSDVVVTSPYSWLASPTVEQAGEAYLFEGPLNGDTPSSAAVATLQGSVAYDLLGNVAAWLGDTDGDGYEEFALGSIGGAFAGLEGNAYVFGGPLSGTQAAVDRADSHFYGLDQDDQAYAVAAAGDLDQDGLADLAISAAQIGTANSGGVFVYYGPLPRGSMPVDAAPDAVLWGTGLPGPIAAPGDVDGDCMPDLVVGAHVLSSTYVFRGGTY